MSSATESSWPKQVADRAKLYIPNDYDPYQQDGNEEPNRCVLDYDAKARLLKLISCQTGETLDIMDPNDIIGASVDVQLFGATDELRVQTFQNKQTVETSGPSTPQGCGIFQSLTEDAEHLFSVSGNATNEPTSAIPFDTQAAAVLTIYVYPRFDPSQDSFLGACGFRPNKLSARNYVKPSDPSKLGSRYARHRRFQIAPTEDFSDVSTLVRAIRKLSNPSATKSSRRLLVIVNPFSGKQRGKEIYEKNLAPMLEQGGFEHDCLITEHANHAEERMKQQAKDSDVTDITEYDGLIGVGGDGILHEIFQGIRDRSDSDKVLETVSIGHIGAGTSNGFAKSLTHACQERDTATDYSFQVAKGKTVKLDISTYQTTKSEYLSFLTYSWGIIADIDIESEAIRFLGSLRMDVWAVWRVLRLKPYRAKFSYVPADKQIDVPGLGEELSKDWVTVEDNFIVFWASHVTHAAERTYHSPPTKLAEGVFTIFIVRNNVSRLRLALILLAMETGGHVDMDGVEFIKCTAYRFEPISRGSFNDVDGEVVESGPIQGKVLPSKIKVFCNL